MSRPARMADTMAVSFWPFDQPRSFCVTSWNGAPLIETSIVELACSGKPTWTETSLRTFSPGRCETKKKAGSRLRPEGSRDLGCEITKQTFPDEPLAV